MKFAHYEYIKNIYVECEEKDKEGIIKQINNFSKELSKLISSIGNDIKVIYGKKHEEIKNYIVINLNSNKVKDNEGYEIEVADIIKVVAATDRGIFYATRTLLSVMHQEETLHYGKIIDYPEVKERSLMVDMGRKFYSKRWIKNLIEYMSIIKLNTLQLHFSENLGFRIACDKYPKIVSKDHLTKADIREIIEYAKEHKIDIIPDFDTPGHLNHILKNYPEFKLERNINGEKTLVESALDIVNPKAIEFIKDILSEYMELFRESKYFHIGADEFIEWEKVQEYGNLISYSKEKYGENASGLEAYIDYVNEIVSFIKEKGFIARAWNDGFFRFKRTSVVELTRNLEITYWTRCRDNMAYVSTFVEKGYKLINFNDNYFYYVLGEAACYKYPKGRKIYENWNNRIFAKNQIIEEKDRGLIIGSSFAIWSDMADEQTEEEVATGLFEPLCAMAEKTWGSNSSNSYKEFESKLNKLKILVNLKTDNFIA